MKAWAVASDESIVAIRIVKMHASELCKEINEGMCTDVYRVVPCTVTVDETQQKETK